MKNSYKSLLALIVLTAVLVPQAIVFATPLTGADTDLSAFYSNTTEDTIDANDSDASGDVTWGFVGGDKEYIGSTGKFSSVYVDVSSAGYGAGGGATAISAEYYDGSTWSTLTVTGNPFGSTGVGYFSFTPPADWATVSVNESPAYYYIRIGAGTQGSGVSQLSVLAYSIATPEFSTYMYVITLMLGGALVYQTLSKEKGFSGMRLG